MQLWALRHGESRANAAGEIVSHPGERAFVWAGLTERGQAQAALVGNDPPPELAAPQDAVIVTSDFARARETAEIIARLWGAAEPTVDTRLRERNFGTLEGLGAEHYDRVWIEDASRQPSSWQVEPCEAVAERVGAVVAQLRRSHSGRDVVLVAHGDVLQILQTVVQGVSPWKHRELPHLENAELRWLASFPEMT